MSDLAPGERFQLQVLFLRELANGYREARDSQERFLRAPDDHEALKSAIRFFHVIAGSAQSAGFNLLSVHASLTERALELGRRGEIADPNAVSQILGEGLAGVGCVLEEHGANFGERPLPRPSSRPPALDEVEGLTLPDSVGEGRQLSKILVVDDDAFSASLVDNTLRASGFMSSYTTNSAEALDRIERELPDLVVLDVSMPDIDGFEICRRVRTHPALAFMPIIFVTRKGELDQRVRGLEVGGNDYIAKPFEPRELVARVRSHLTRLAALRQMAIRDGLTRCFNHRYFKNRLEQELSRARRYEQPLAVAMVDVDHFKQVNDEQGHLTGDMALAHLANVVMACVRGSDVVARYGGEEFAILMIQSGMREASIIAERIRSRVAAEAFKITDSEGQPSGKSLSLTVSVGVAVFEQGDTPATIVARADRALYEAKDSGRNAVRVAEPDIETERPGPPGVSGSNGDPSRQ